MVLFNLGKVSRRIQRTVIIFLSLTASSANTASSETGVKITTSYLRGEVVAVDENLVLSLKITEKVNFDHSPADKIKIFQLDTTPAALRWLTLGRTVNCVWAYSKESYSVAACSLEDVSNDKKILLKSWIRINQLVESLGLGVSKCSQEDMEGITKSVSEDYMKSVC